MDEEKIETIVVEPKRNTIVAFCGLIVSVLCLLSLINQEPIGYFLTFCFSFIFGEMFFIVVALLAYVGMRTFIKGHLGKFKFSWKLVLLVSLFLLISIWLSDKGIGSYTRYFDYVRKSTFVVQYKKIHYLGGGIVGVGFYKMFASILGAKVAKFVYIGLFAVVVFILIFPYMKKFFGKIKNTLERLKLADLYENEHKDDPKEITPVEEVKEEPKQEFIVEPKTEEVTPMEEYDYREHMFTDKILKDLEEEAQPQPFNVFKDNLIDDDIQSSTDTGELRPFNVFESGIEETEVRPIVPPEVESEESEITKEKTIGELNEEWISSSGSIENILKEEDYSSLSKQDEPKAVTPEVVAPDLAEAEMEDRVPPEEELKVAPEAKNQNYIYPTLDLLDSNPQPYLSPELKEEILHSKDVLNQKLSELRIRAAVESYTVGPCVTRFEIVPEPGSSTKVSNIESVKDDLMLSIAATKVRMESPIPGMSAVGLEIPNKNRSNVYLRDVLEGVKDRKDLLIAGIGKDINGEPISIRLDKMPHLLIAGQTGSGKSVCLSTIIVSLILRTNPDDVKLMLVDPKKVEMLLYTNMPHLMCPVITDAKKASVALQKVVKEMENRYDVFSKSGVRNIEGYNEFAKNNGKDKMPYLVIIIDELADLMLVASKDVEDSIQRITQLARAAGIHLIVATQRPSVNVITGVIKANIPSRIAFSVASQVDSRTILDGAGAEDLLGRGDMLLAATGLELKRVQGAYVSDEEIARVVNFVKQNGTASFMDDFLNLDPEPIPTVVGLPANDDEDDDDDEEVYQLIRAFVIETRRASASLFQRKFSIGFNRAARMLDRLEAEGVVGPQNGAKPREVLVDE